MKIIGIDPGYAIVGWGVVEYRSSRFITLGYGAITTPAHMEFPKRLEVIYQQTQTILRTYQPQHMSIEKLFFANNKTTAIDVAQARGVVLLSAQLNHIAVSQYTPIQVKQSVTGYGRATKQQVMDMTKRLLRLERIPRLDDTADALALAIAHAHSASSKLKFC